MAKNKTAVGADHRQPASPSKKTKKAQARTRDAERKAKEAKNRILDEASSEVEIMDVDPPAAEAQKVKAVARVEPVKASTSATEEGLDTMDVAEETPCASTERNIPRLLDHLRRELPEVIDLNVLLDRYTVRDRDSGRKLFDLFKFFTVLKEAASGQVDLKVPGDLELRCARVTRAELAREDDQGSEGASPTTFQIKTLKKVIRASKLDYNCYSKMVAKDGSGGNGAGKDRKKKNRSGSRKTSTRKRPAPAAKELELEAFDEAIAIIKRKKAAALRERADGKNGEADA